MTDLSLEDRGRLPSHVWKGMNEMMAMIVADDDWWDDADEEDDQFFMYLQGSLFRHEQTWARNSKPGRPQPAAAEISEPWQQLPTSTFEELTGWSPERFMEMNALFVLLPNTIVTPTRYKASRPLCFFILLARWTHRRRSWIDLARELNMSRAKMIDLFETFGTMIFDNAHYHVLSTMIDVPRVLEQVCNRCQSLPAYLRLSTPPS